MVSYRKKYQTSTREQPCPKIAPAKQRSASKSPQPWWRNLAGCWGAASASQPSTAYSDLWCPPQCCMDARHEHWWQKRRSESLIKFMRKLFCLSYLEHSTHEYVRDLWALWALWVQGNVFMPLSSYGSRYGLVRWHGTIAYANYQAGRAPSIAFVGKDDNVRVVPTTPYNGQTRPCQTS